MSKPDENKKKSASTQMVVGLSVGLAVGLAVVLVVVLTGKPHLGEMNQMASLRRYSDTTTGRLFPVGYNDREALPDCRNRP
jgi:hypothetical protein